MFCKKNDVRIVNNKYQPFEINVGINSLTYKLYTTIWDGRLIMISDDDEDLELNKPIDNYSDKNQNLSLFKIGKDCEISPTKTE